MPKVDDQFAGHFFQEDPRNNLTGAFGCNWPTVPAYRYKIYAPFADGDWLGFRASPPLVQLRTKITEHDVVRWTMEGAFGIFEYVNLDKLPIDTEWDGFEWVMTWKIIDFPVVYSNSFIEPSPRKCNYDVALPNWDFPGRPGRLGPLAFAYQVVWNEEFPPDWDTIFQD